MTNLVESRVFQDLTNRAAAPKKAWPELSAETTPHKPAAACCCSNQLAAAAVPELEAVVNCSTELHQLWTKFASGGSSCAAYLLHHFAALDAQMLLQPPSAAPPGLSEEVLRLAEAPPPSSLPRGQISLASGVCGSAEPGSWSQVMEGVAGEGSAWRPTPMTAQAPERPQCRAFPLQRPPLLQDDSDRLERRLSFEAAANSSDDCHSSASRAAAEEQSPSGSLGDEELVPPSWRQKELCEEELENRLADLLQQEHFGFDAEEEEEDDDDGFQCWEGGDSAAASDDEGGSSGAAASCWPEAASGGAVSSLTESGPIPEDRWNFKTPPRRQSSKRAKPPAAAGVAAAQNCPPTQQPPAAAKLLDLGLP
eukprot:TRINITY_DN20370_c0_g1_i1.p1 TRINITY_DN20370_c0_g1~~TRINITY_DN20370_c0_g1_i1.p1  ORF type:complete len:366 (+),score=110.33 TRINITY_DN20370_c0_g1_i1:276-1373(+)